jgi:hypothetical protein
MDNITFNELLKEGEIDLILMDGPQALTKKQLKAVENAVNPVGRNISDKMKNMAAKAILGKSGSNLLKNLSPVKTPKLNKTNKAFYTRISEGGSQNVHKGDGTADILAKMMNFMKKIHKEKVLQYEIDEDFEKERIYESIREKQKEAKEQSKIKLKARLIKGGKSGFEMILTGLGAFALLTVTDKAIAKLTEYKKDISDTKKIIDDKISSAKKYLSDINILGFRPFQFEGEETEINEPEENKRYRDIVAGIEGGGSGYDAIYGDGGKVQTYKGKKVSELTIKEALDFSKSKGEDRGAIGRYQFVPSTLEKLYKLAGLNLDDPFNSLNQDKLFEALTESNRNVLKASLEREPTESELAVAHAVGAPGALELFRQSRINPKKSAADILFPDTKKYAAARSVNPQLKKPVGEYLSGYESAFSSPKPKLTPKVDTTSQEPLINIPKLDVPKSLNGEKLSMLSILNSDMVGEPVTPVVIINNSTNNNIINPNRKQQVIEMANASDLPLFQQG